MHNKNNHLSGFLIRSGLSAWEDKFFIAVFSVLFIFAQIIPSALAMSNSNSPIVSVICSSAGITSVSLDENGEEQSSSGVFCSFCSPTGSNSIALLPNSEAASPSLNFDANLYTPIYERDHALDALYYACCRGPPVITANNSPPLPAHLLSSLAVKYYLKGISS